MNDMNQTFWDEIVEIEFVDNEDVYDLTVDDVHNFFANGLLVHNCAELILSPYDSCRLLLINLTKFVKDPFQTSAKFDFDRFKKVAAKAQKLMDDLVDLEIEAVDAILNKISSDPESDAVKRPEMELWQKIRKAASGARRTGLGITGIGDALASAGVVYGSQESIDKTEEIYKTLALSAYRSSVDMAKDRGSFPVYDWNLENNSVFLQRLMEADKELFSDWKKHGRRNIALTTTAPAGSVSCLTQTTSGIEPAYLLSYTRRKKINPNDTLSRVDFVDQLGDKWQEYKVYHHGFKAWMDATGKTDEQIAESPYWKATSNDVDWPMSVKLQAAAQKWVCHAISKTCVAGDSLVETNQGLLYIDEIAENANCKQESSATVSNITTKNHFGREALVGFVLNQGQKQVYRVTTKTGNSIKTTADHKFILLHEDDDIESWVELSELKIGDRIKLS